MTFKQYTSRQLTILLTDDLNFFIKLEYIYIKKLNINYIIIII